MNCAGTEQSLWTQALGAERAPEPVECPPARWGFASQPADRVVMEQGSAWFYPAFGWDGQSRCGCCIARKGRTTGQHPTLGLLQPFQASVFLRDGPGRRALPETMRKHGQLCPILMPIPSLLPQFPNSGQKHGCCIKEVQGLHFKR